MSVVVFDPTVFKIRYPEFATVDSALLTLYFNEAMIYVDNTESSVITDTNIRGMILNMIVAHIATLQARISSGSPLVGRISSASEGGVSVSVSAAPSTGSRIWFDQTLYGDAAWKALRPYGHAIYITAPQPIPTYVPEG